MATLLNANPIIYKPSQITREAASDRHPHSLLGLLDADVSETSLPTSLQTLTSVPVVHPSQLSALHHDSIDTLFSLSDYAHTDADDSDKDSVNVSVDEWDALEIFDLIRSINDPEHPLTLEELKVCQLELISIDDSENEIHLNFTPTIPHCSMATLIGLCLRVKLLRSLPSRFKISIEITPGMHATEEQINKQLNDKERVAAALENSHLLDIVNKCLEKKQMSAIL